MYVMQKTKRKKRKENTFQKKTLNHLNYFLVFKIYNDFIFENLVKALIK